MRKPEPKRLRTVLRTPVATALLCLAFGCARVGSSAGSAHDGGDASPEANAPDAVAPAPAPAGDAAVDSCINPCRQIACAAGATTSVSGTVFAPNGKLPLYNVAVYVPTAPLEPFPAGVSCDRCGTPVSGKPIVSALSDSQGKFKLVNVPAGMNVPLVFQVGKWRRKVTIPNVAACQDTALTDPNMTRLPRNRTEGDLPKIAVTTGTCDQLGCLLPKLGIDASELGIAGQDKSAAYFDSQQEIITGPAGGQQGPANMRPATELWNDEAVLSKYDLALLSCECSENLATKPAMSFMAMTNYLAKGGRMFGSHYTYAWLRNSPDMALTTAVTISTQSPVFGLPLLKIDASFPKGKAMAEWMKFVDPSSVYGEIASYQTYNAVRAVKPPSALAWASSGSSSEPPLPPGIAPPINPGVTDPQPHPRIMTVNTPAGMAADKQCGRVAYLDAHIVLDSNMAPANSMFPGNCGTDLSKGEEALAFLFFDLASCIQDDTKPVVPPLIIP